MLSICNDKNKRASLQILNGISKNEENYLKLKRVESEKRLYLPHFQSD